MLPFDVLDVIRRKSAEHGLPPAHLAAIVEVESAGKVFATVDGRRKPIILFEPHLFYRALSGAARAEAVKLNLASKKWNKRLYAETQAGRWEQIDAAAQLLLRHELPTDAAYESASYGVGQVLGQHWRSLGYDSLKTFLSTMMSGVDGQIEVMLKYIEVNGLQDELIDGRWAAFARGYNGPSYAKNKYHTKMEAAAAVYGGKVAAPDGMLRMGSKGARVRELQALLVRAGYQVKVDGDFGTSTKSTLMAFQKAHGIKVDGVYGPETEGMLAEFRQGRGDKPGSVKATEIDGVIKGGGAVTGGAIIAGKIGDAKDAVESAIPQLQEIEPLHQAFSYGVTALTVIASMLALAGLCWMVWSWLESRKTVEV